MVVALALKTCQDLGFLSQTSALTLESAHGPCKITFGDLLRFWLIQVPICLTDFPPPLVLCASGFSLSSSSSPPPPTKELRFWFFPACSERSLATAERSSSSSSRRSLSRPVLALSLPSRSRSAAAQLRPLVRRFVSRGGLVASKAAGGGGFGGEASDGMQGVLFSEW